MALVDVVKREMNSKELVYKFPSEDLRMGTQLVVYAGQTAFFVKGGKVMDGFESGTYTIRTENVPLLNKVINLPFGGRSPFQAEVWFVNCLSIMDTKWGTPTPVQLEDPRYGVIVPVRSFGQYEMRVCEPRTFLETLIGNMTSFSMDKINAYFRGKMMSFYTNLLSDKMTRDGISVLNINSHLLEMSEYVKVYLDKEFRKYGLSLESFSIMSVNVPEDDPSFVKLKEAKELAAQVKITGQDIYRMGRTFDVMDKAAANEGGAGVIGLGAEIAAGMTMGQQMGSALQQSVAAPQMPPPPPLPQYYLGVGGQRQGPFNVAAVEERIRSGQALADTLVWKPGMSAWGKLAELPEFASYFHATPPPISSN